MEITNETIAKVFAGYLGQEVNFPVNYNFSGIKKSGNRGVLSGVKIDQYKSIVSIQVAPGFYNITDFKLLLTPLSKITDEHAIEVRDILCSKNNGELLTSQYLQDQGYALPHFLLNGQTPIEAGIALDKTLI